MGNLNTMQTLTIELTGNNSLKALKDLEHKRLIKILKEPDLNSYSLSGEPISNEDFRRWVDYAENSPTVKLTEAKLRWAEQKKKLQKLIR
jgi:predicted ATP-grasp superfamily ATP-dependent carboligase